MAQVADVNSTDLRAAIALGCRTMQRVFDADDHHVPFFGSRVHPEPALRFSAHHSESHVPGRHLNALLNAADAAGVAVAPEAVAHHRRAALLSYSGAVPLPMNRPARGQPVTNFCPHNLREGFHALYSLIRFRGDEQAAALAARSIQAVFALWSPAAGWDTARLQQLGIHFQPCQSPIHGEARMLGPLVKLYRATGHAPALDLALVLREQLLEHHFPDDGAFVPERLGTTHVHSITCVLSSLAQLADLMGDAALMARVKAFYDNGLWSMRDQLGWSPESTVQRDSDHGEANNSGDILETALILGRWGHAAGYDDAEAILRGHLLPAQLRDTSFITDPPNPLGVDGLRDVADRHLGAYGFPAPYGHRSSGRGRGGLSFNMDIVGGTVGSLCEAYREVVRTSATGTWVELLFDHDAPTARVRSPYTGDGLRITPCTSSPLFVRLPPWVDRRAVQVTVEGRPLLVATASEGRTDEPAACRWAGRHLLFPQPRPNTEISLRFPLPVRTLVLSPALHIHPIRVQLRGDAVLAMDDFGAELTFFPRLEPAAAP